MVFDVVCDHFGRGVIYPATVLRQRRAVGHAIDYSRPADSVRLCDRKCAALAQALPFDAFGSTPSTRSWKRAALGLRLSRAVWDFAAATGRLIHLVRRMMTTARAARSLTDPPHGKCRAQWNDDYHHAWHRLLTGAASGYYRVSWPDPRHLARVLASRSIRARPRRIGTVASRRSVRLVAACFRRFSGDISQPSVR